MMGVAWCGARNEAREAETMKMDCWAKLVTIVSGVVLGGGLWAGWWAWDWWIWLAVWVVWAVLFIVSWKEESFWLWAFAVWVVVVALCVLLLDGWPRGIALVVLSSIAALRWGWFSGFEQGEAAAGAREARISRYEKERLERDAIISALMCSECEGTGECSECEGTRKCSACEGTGECSECDGKRECSECEGTGGCSGDDGTGEYYECYKCDGTGNCSGCHGWGKCSECDGRGKCFECEGRGKCSECDGSGRTPEAKLREDYP